MKSEAQLVLETHLAELGLADKLSQEFAFHPERKWRFDYAIKTQTMRLAIEIEGGIWKNGRHTRGKGYQGDLDKYNAAILRGWRVFRFSTEDVLTGKARLAISKYLMLRSLEQPDTKNVTFTPPRYDEVFVEGLATLDKAAANGED